jgi:hypothetical protein
MRDEEGGEIKKGNERGGRWETWKEFERGLLVFIIIAFLLLSCLIVILHII